MCILSPSVLMDSVGSETHRVCLSPVSLFFSLSECILKWRRNAPLTQEAIMALNLTYDRFLVLLSTVVVGFRGVSSDT